MNELHESVMDELLNGEMRRAEEERVRKELALEQIRMYQQQAQRAYPQGTYGSLGSVGTSGATLATAGTIGNGSIQLGSETVNEGLIKNIKKALGL
jgi:hypothetical protein